MTTTFFPRRETAEMISELMNVWNEAKAIAMSEGMTEAEADKTVGAWLDKMLGRYTRGGGNRQAGSVLLVEVLSAHDGDNRDRALQHWGFTR